MARPKIKKIIEKIPKQMIYIPKMIKVDELIVPYEELTISEFEALRLKHFEKLNQLEAANKMEISQSTFSRVLESAHQKITNALVNGKAIHIEGGTYKIKKNQLGFQCFDCLYNWELKKIRLEAELTFTELNELIPKSNTMKCPNCGSFNIIKIKRNIFEAE
ncbi:MAG: DUF134 domain-containing protein [Promethearchaeota archaeon]